MATIADLKQLKPLPKTHIWWYPKVWPAADLLAELGRITGSLSLSLNWGKPDQIKQVGELVKAQNLKLCVVVQPYQLMQAAKLPADDWGTVCQNDLANLSNWLSIFTSVAPLVTHVLIDLENPAWKLTDDNESDVMAKFAAVWGRLVNWYPKATFVWYAAGASGPAAVEDGWAEMGYVPRGLPRKYNTASFYYDAVDTNLGVLARTGRPFVPFVPLGCCQRQQPLKWGDLTPLGLSAPVLQRLGAAINTKFAAGQPQRFPESEAEFAAFWPGIGADFAPYWLDDLVTYTKAATA